MNTVNRKKISVSLKIADIQEYPEHFSIYETEDTEQLKSALLARYKPGHGSLGIAFRADTVFLEWSPETVSKEGEAYHYAALEFTKQKLYDKAIRTWEKALDQQPHDVDYLYKLAILYFERKKYTESILQLEKAVEICPIHDRALLLLGINWIKLRKFEKALTYVTESHFLNKKSMLTYLNLGAIYSVKKDFPRAIEMYERCIDLSPREARAYLGLARIYSVLNDPTKANDYFTKVIKLAPGTRMAEYAKRSVRVEQTAPADHAAVPASAAGGTAGGSAARDDSFSIGMGQYLSGKYRQSATTYKAYLQAHPSDDYGWYLLGETMLRTGEYEESADCLKRAIRINGKRGLYYKTLGISLHFLGKPKETIQVLKKAIELGKRDALCLTLYGINLMYEKATEDGMNYLQMSMKKNPNNPLAMYNLALAHVKMHDPEKAQTLLNRILNFDYYTPAKEQAGTLLATLQSP
ncbi:tetratricopeptide repeat protein [bacterium]|nr:tetratricopeptide repeat protein [bacterium]